MAHTCPDCGQVCYCNGDIDDICLDLPKDQNRCKHYLGCLKEDSEELENQDD